MAEIINKFYGGGVTGYEELVADIQKLWDFSPIETATNGAGNKTTTLWINDVTNIKIVQRSSYTPQVYSTYKGTSIQIDNHDDNSGTTRLHMYGVKTNRGMVVVMRASGTVNYLSRYILVGDAENPHSGDVEKTVGIILGDFLNTANLKPCLLASDTNVPLYDSAITISTEQRNSVIIPFMTQSSSFIMKSIYRLSKTQSTPFFGDCTFNGRKFHSVGAILIEDD